MKLLGTIRLNHPKVLKKGFGVNVQTRNPERPEAIPFIFCPRSSIGLELCTTDAEVGSSNLSEGTHTSVAQLVEHWIPNPGVGGSSPSWCAIW